jgi:hypothetical protein
MNPHARHHPPQAVLRRRGTNEQPVTEIDPLPKAQPVFIDCLEATYNGKPTALPLADIYRVDEIAIAAERAAAEGKVVSV